MAVRKSVVAAATTTSTVLGLFDAVIGATPDEIKAQQNDLLKNSIKRAIRSGHDSAVGKKLEAQQKLNELKRNIQSFDVNAILTKANEIETIEKQIVRAKDLFKEMFGTELVVIED